MERKRKILIIYFLTLAGILFWLGVIFLAPCLKSRGLALSIIFYSCFSPTCHQIPSRSFFAFGHPLAVCARCLGVYFGFLAGTGLYPLLRGFKSLRPPKIKSFLFISLPIFFDTLGNFFHLWRSPNALRLATGFLWGVILPFYFITGISEFFINWRSLKFRPKKQ